MAQAYPVEQVAVGDLTPHPRNYRKHPPAQVKHLMASIQEHGFYRNVIVTTDNTILAGHGVVAAAKKLQLPTVPAIRLPVDPHDPAALKVLAGDNELGSLGIVDQDYLNEILSELKEADNLLGTGYDAEAVEGLLQEADPHAFAASQCVGLPEYTSEDNRPIRQILFNFATPEAVAAST